MLELRGVSYAYGESPALHEVSVRFGVGAAGPAARAGESPAPTQKQGELVALTGPNGSGKSTLLKLAARVLVPTTGEVRFDDRPLRDWPPKEYARQVGYLPQDPDPVFPMRAIDVVVTGRAPFLSRFEWESDADYIAAREALARCDAAHLAERYLDEMSGGERKRVFLARVLAGAPRLILLDEPLSALDVSHVQQFSLLLREVVDRTGCTVVFASHDLNWAAAYSDRMLVMRDGRVAADATPAALMTAEAMHELFGFDAQPVESGGRTWMVPKRN
jgi:iron complex transport system ATP-binding protein